MNKVLKITIGISVSAFFLWLVLKDLHYDEFLTAITQVQIPLLVVGLVIWLVGYGMRGVRAKILLQPIKDISWRKSMTYVLIGFTANNTLPLRAGEFVRPYVVGIQENIPKTTVFATIAAERLFDGLVIVMLTILGATVMPIEQWMRNVIWGSAILFVLASFFFVFLLFANRQSMRLIGYFLQYIPQGFRTKIEKLLNVFTIGLEFLRNPAQLVSIIGTTCAIWILESVFYFCAGLSFGFDIHLLQAMFVMGMLNLAILIPSSPGYVGTFEYVTVAALGLLGVSHSQAAGYALVSHIVQFFAINIPGVVLWLRLGLRLGGMQSARN